MLKIDGFHVRELSMPKTKLYHFFFVSDTCRKYKSSIQKLFHVKGNSSVGPKHARMWSRIK